MSYLKNVSVYCFLLLGFACLSAANANPVLQPGVWVQITPPSVQTGNSSTCIGQGIAIDPKNPSTIYWCNTPFTVSDGGLYKSTDGGSNWKRIGKVQPNWTGANILDMPIHIRIDPKDSKHMYVGDGVRGSTTGFWISNDGGDSFYKPQGWVDIATSTGYYIDDVYDVAVDPSDFNHILTSSHSAWKWQDAEIGNNAGILESTDGGISWIAHKPGNWGYGNSIKFLYDPALHIGNSKTWLVGGQGGGNWRTSDGGATWTRVFPQGSGIYHGGGTIYYSKTGVLYASNYPQTIRSTDNGLNWTAVGPNGGTTGICGDGNLLYTETTDGTNTPYYVSPETDGLTWTPFNGGKQTLNNGGPFEMAFDSVNGIMYSSALLQGCWALKIQNQTNVKKNLSAKASGALNGSRGMQKIVENQFTVSQEVFSNIRSIYNIKGQEISHTALLKNAHISNLIHCFAQE
jgi:hypothetical protein